MRGPNVLSTKQQTITVITFLATFVFLQCSPARQFKDAKNPMSPILATNKTFINFGCNEEATKSPARKFDQNPDEYRFTIDPICGRQGVKIEDEKPNAAH